MAITTFYKKLEKRQESCNSFLSIGLDPILDKLPEKIKKIPSLTKKYVAFNKAIIDATHEFACAFKPQIAHYEAAGSEGWAALEQTFHYLKSSYSDIPVILDAKRADIGSTNEEYAKAIFDILGADAVTVHPYLGREALLPFLERKDKGIIILVRTSNSGAGEFQDLLVESTPLYQIVAKHIATEWNYNNNCCIVVGATYPEELASIRKIVDDMPILIPGIGAQGGDIEQTVKAGQDSQGKGMIIHSSRSILYASNGDDFAEAAAKEARRLRDEINTYRNA